MGKTYQSVVINAEADDVWTRISDFHNLDWSPNVITKVDVVGDRGSREVGAGRVLNDAFHETLIEIDDESKTLRYSIDDGPSPVGKDDVSDYVGQVVVRPVTEGGGTFVEWSSSWKNNDEPTHEFCHGIYVALLGDMKASLEV